MKHPNSEGRLRSLPVNISERASEMYLVTRIGTQFTNIEWTI